MRNFTFVVCLWKKRRLPVFPALFIRCTANRAKLGSGRQKSSLLPLGERWGWFWPNPDMLIELKKLSLASERLDWLLTNSERSSTLRPPQSIPIRQRVFFGLNSLDDDCDVHLKRHLLHDDSYGRAAGFPLSIQRQCGAYNDGRRTLHWLIQHRRLRPEDLMEACALLTEIFSSDDSRREDDEDLVEKLVRYVRHARLDEELRNDALIMLSTCQLRLDSLAANLDSLEIINGPCGSISLPEPVLLALVRAALRLDDFDLFARILRNHQRSMLEERDVFDVFMKHFWTKTDRRMIELPNMQKWLRDHVNELKAKLPLQNLARFIQLAHDLNKSVEAVEMIGSDVQIRCTGCSQRFNRKLAGNFSVREFTVLSEAILALQLSDRSSLDGRRTDDFLLRTFCKNWDQRPPGDTDAQALIIDGKAIQTLCIGKRKMLSLRDSCNVIRKQLDDYQTTLLFCPGNRHSVEYLSLHSDGVRIFTCDDLIRYDNCILQAAFLMGEQAIVLSTHRFAEMKSKLIGRELRSIFDRWTLSRCAIFDPTTWEINLPNKAIVFNEPHVPANFAWHIPVQVSSDAAAEPQWICVKDRKSEFSGAVPIVNDEDKEK